jgi:hypothetical protein
VKLYDLLVEGYHTPLSANEIANLYSAGRLRKNDPCKEAAAKHWRTVDELFPLLKYDSRTPAPAFNRRDAGSSPRPASTSALKAGWICFSFGLALSWFFPLGNAFFSLALVTAAVAMCTHQVSRGLVLLLSSFAGIGLSMVLFLAVAAVKAEPAIKQMSADLNRLRAAQKKLIDPMQPVTLAPDPQSLVPGDPNLSGAGLAQVPATYLSPRFRQATAMAQHDMTAASDRSRRSQAIRDAEQQRDRINAKERRLEQLQKAIEGTEDQIRRIRDYGGDESIFIKQRDELIRQKWDLQR